MDCIFCKIIENEIPSYTIYENDEFKVIFDRFPSSLGHTLIIPKNHVENIFEINPEQAARLFQLATKISVILKEVFQFEGLNVLQNNGLVAGQSVFHFHLHLIPRYSGDGVNIKWNNIDPSDEEFQEKLKKFQEKMSEK